MKGNIYHYIAVMAIVTYMIRMLPLVLLKKEITSPFVRSFLHYVPYACLAAMTFPAICYAPNKLAAGILAFLVAIPLSLRGKSLIVVALAACAAVFVVELILP